jgi:NAD(P)-dependent dehydrogenase (short-subunit alcohol dehydrogenase family)
MITGAGYPGIGGAAAIHIAREAAARLAIFSTVHRSDHAMFLQELQMTGDDVLSLSGDLTDPEVPGRLVVRALEF